MKTFTLFFCGLLCSFALQAQDDKEKNISVSIENLRSDEGQVLIGLYTKETFMKGRGMRDTIIPADSKNIRVTFKNIPEGEYAVMAMHDKNTNFRMDFDSGGMPLEDYGMTGNDMSYGPPTFDLAKFILKDKDVSFNIRF